MLWGIASLVAVALAGCEYPLGPPAATASFVTPAIFNVAISGNNAAEAPALRKRFYAEAEAFARANGCLHYRVLKETFITAANIAPRVSTEPSWIFGRRPVYAGLVECGLPDPRPAANPSR